MEKLIRCGIPSDFLHRLIPLTLRSRLRQRVRALNTVAVAKPELAAGTRAALEDYYAAEIERLQELTGLDLRNWRNSAPAGTARTAP